MQCAAATIMSKGVGMPCLYSCCFVNIFAARNFVRYQNRVKGNDCIDECCVPWSTYCCGGLLSAIIPCFWCIVCPAFVLFIVQLLNEVEKRPAAQPRYLVGAADNVIAAAITLAPPEVYGKVIAMNPIRESNEIPNETIPETNPNYQTADDTKAEIPIVHGVPIREDQSSTVSPKAEN